MPIFSWSHVKAWASDVSCHSGQLGDQLSCFRPLWGCCLAGMVSKTSLSVNLPCKLVSVVPTWSGPSEATDPKLWAQLCFSVSTPEPNCLNTALFIKWVLHKCLGVTLRGFQSALTWLLTSEVKAILAGCTLISGVVWGCAPQWTCWRHCASVGAYHKSLFRVLSQVSFLCRPKQFCLVWDIDKISTVAWKFREIPVI